MKHKTACALIINGGKILLTKRARAPFVGKWALPSGIGESMKGRSPDVGIVEEVRCDLGTSSFKGKQIFSLPIKDSETTNEVIVFAGSIDVSDIHPDPKFSNGIKWVNTDSADGFTDLAFEHEEIIKKYLSELNEK